MSGPDIKGSVVLTTRLAGIVATETFPFALNPHATFKDVIVAQAALNKIAGPDLRFEIMTERKGPKLVTNDFSAGHAHA